MPNKKLKKVMTDLAAGHISQEKADELLGKKPDEKVNQKEEVDNHVNQKVNQKKTQTRKLNPKGGKK